MKRTKKEYEAYQEWLNTLTHEERIFYSSTGEKVFFAGYKAGYGDFKKWEAVINGIKF